MDQSKPLLHCQKVRHKQIKLLNCVFSHTSYQNRFAFGRLIFEVFLNRKKEMKVCAIEQSYSHIARLLILL